MLRRRVASLVDLSGFARRVALATGTCALLAAGLPAHAAVPVVSCADGSVIIGKNWEAVHCPGAVVASAGAGATLGSARYREPLVQKEWLSRREASRERDLEEQIIAVERRALVSFIERNPERVTTVIVRGDGDPSQIRMRLAYSPAIEARLRAALALAGIPAAGPVLAFWPDPASADLGGAPPSFAQRGRTFRPRISDPRQLGWIAGDGSAHGRDGPKLGYVVLPAGFDPARTLVIFWGDAFSAIQFWHKG